MWKAPPPFPPALALLASGFFFAPACSSKGGEGAPPTLASGARLKARLLVPTGTTEMTATSGLHVGWHDQELGIDCRFTKSPDGGYLCLPILQGGLRVYSTPTCEPGTDLMALLDSPSTDGARECAGLVFYGYEPPGCGERTTGGVLRLLGPTSLSNHGYVKTFFGDCNPRPAPLPPPDGARWIYCTVEEVPLETFVPATEQIRKVGAKRQLVLAGEDGSREPRAVLHPDFEAPLVRDWWGGKDLIADVGHAGGICTVPGSGEKVCDVAVSSCAPAVLVRPDACTATTYAASAGPAANVTCGSQNCFDLGPALPRIPYEERALGSARLRPLWVSEGPEALAPTGYFRDEKLGTTCRPEAAQGGKIRCVPRDPTVSHDFESGFREIFSDPKCEASLGFEYRPLCGETAPRYAATPIVTYADAKIVRMVPLAEAIPATTYAGRGPPLGRAVLCMPQEKPPTALFRAEPLEQSELVELVEARQ
jgi:hypothetical protein